jgi:hypothetical protein
MHCQSQATKEQEGSHQQLVWRENRAKAKAKRIKILVRNQDLSVDI